MSDCESSEELRRAIALSLEQTPPEPHQTRKAVVIDLVSDEDSEDDDDLDAPISTSQHPRAASKGSGYGVDNGKGPGFKANSVIKSPMEKKPAEDLESSKSEFLGLDRKKMEEERLARVVQYNRGTEEDSARASKSRKRKALESPFQSQNPNKRQATPTTTDFKSPFGLLPTKPGDMSGHYPTRKSSHLAQDGDAKGDSNFRANFSSHAEVTKNLAEATSYRNQQRDIGDHIRYPDGVVKKTWVYGCPRQGDDVKIEEVFQKDDLELAVLSSFQIDPEWVSSKLDAKSKVIWVLQAKSDAEVNFGFDYLSLLVVIVTLF